jgi:HPt (histidine-containing phosphotransfer) domain-containing protein
VPKISLPDDATVQRIMDDVLSPQLQKNVAVILEMSPLDHALLDNMRKEMRGRGIDWLLDLYLRELPNYLREIRGALEANRGEPLYLAAHKFKGGSSNLGAHQVVELCKLLEQLAKQEHLKTANQLLPTLETAIVQLRTEIMKAQQNHDDGPSRT